MTITLNGPSNMEDGGTPFGNPTIKDFTNSDSQWFIISNLYVIERK